MLFVVIIVVVTFHYFGYYFYWFLFTPSPFRHSLWVGFRPDLHSHPSQWEGKTPPFNLKSHKEQPGIYLGFRFWLSSNSSLTLNQFSPSFARRLLLHINGPIGSFVLKFLHWIVCLLLFCTGNWMPSSMMQQCWTTWQAEMKAASWWPLAVERSSLPLVMALPSKKILGGSARWTLLSCSYSEMVSQRWWLFWWPVQNTSPSFFSTPITPAFPEKYFTVYCETWAVGMRVLGLP